MNFGKSVKIQTIEAYEQFVKDNYSRNPAVARQWLHEQSRLAASPDSVIPVWIETDAKWLLVRKSGRFWTALNQDMTGFPVVYDNADWQLLRKP